MAFINRRCNSIEDLNHDPALLQSPIGRAFPGIHRQARKVKTTLPPASVELAIIGGGIIGCALACQAWHSLHLRDRMVILDTQEYLVQKLFDAIWKNGQRVMRSPYEHHIAPDGDLQMVDLARLHAHLLTPLERQQITAALSGQRSVVPIDIFMAHTTHMIDIHHLRDFAYQFPVQNLRREEHADGRNWIIQGSDGSTIRARVVVMATGSKQVVLDETLNQALHLYKDRVQQGIPHIRPHEQVLVVGSGLTAGHTIMKVVEAGAHPSWNIRGEERYRCADFDTAYFRTEGIAYFRRQSLSEKIALLAEESRGSLMLEFIPLLNSLEEKGDMQVYRSTAIEKIMGNASGQLRVQFVSGATIIVDKIIVATGWLPEHTLLPGEVVPLDGKYPLLNDTLDIQGCENLFVAGVLGSLALGPAAKNIDGARLASEILVPILEQRLGQGSDSTPVISQRISGTTALSFPARKVVQI